jgi:hypothetical protein
MVDGRPHALRPAGERSGAMICGVGRRGDIPPARRCQSRVQVCDLQKTFSTQPCIFSELPETLPEPL